VVFNPIQGNKGTSLVTGAPTLLEILAETSFHITVVSIEVEIAAGILG